MALVGFGGDDVLRCSGGFQGFLHFLIYFFSFVVLLFAAARLLCAFFWILIDPENFGFWQNLDGKAMEEGHDGVVCGAAASCGEMEVSPCGAHISGTSR